MMELKQIILEKMNINMENKEHWQLHHTDGEFNMG